ncbi:serine hydrolase [Microbulbifer sp. MLAF003]|uniref:serine hydrolase domain-containing protein n=1 Tax=Microbulbifer TaxID=48073 RepID=UPI00037F72A9|nr:MULTISPECIES: serine hydrolase domain-containing protein [Microbulbifer]WHI50091.1 serine hydrolase [Microbulbifer sp. MLAF003]
MKGKQTTSILSNLFICASLSITVLTNAMDASDTSNYTEYTKADSTVTYTNKPRIFDHTKVDEAVKNTMRDIEIPGMAIALVARPEMPIIWSKGYGVKSLEEGGLVTRNTAFWLASVSKVVMGTAIAKAQEDGILSLDQEVQNLLAGGYFNIDNPGSQPITLQHLVTHRSGINDGPTYQCSYYINHGDGTHSKLMNLKEPGICPEDSPITLAGFLGAYLDSEGEFYDSEHNFLSQTPGEAYEYSNIGAALAGYTVELASGFSLADYADREIFTPLGMINTSWKLPDFIPGNIASPHYAIENNLTPIPHYDLATWPDGGLRSSAYDMALFLATIMNGGELVSRKQGSRILEAKTVSNMLTPIEDGFGIFWGLDFLWNYNGKNHKLNGHNGRDPGSFSYLLYNPADKIGVVLLANSNLENANKIKVNKLITKLFEAASGLQTSTQ